MSHRLPCCFILLCAFAAHAVADEPSDLPIGAAPAPLEAEHFPDRLHAYVWRNWGLVPNERLASVVDATPEQLAAIAESMGLPATEEASAEQAKSMYITLVRRNWHLLPYDQLLKLVDMSTEEFDFALREDDFLFVKLGNLKPRCEPLKYVPPDDATTKRAAKVRVVVQKHFGDALTRPSEPRLAFVQALSKVPENAEPLTPAEDNAPRYAYSYFGSFGDPLLDPEVASYPDGLLRQLAAHGANGVWLHVVLRQLASGGEAFPEFGKDHEKRLENLRVLVERARKHGIRVYLYLNEPRTMPPSFFEGREEMAGITRGDYRTMCTSDPTVRSWVRDACEQVFREVPHLGGVFTITGSENLTHCYSHGPADGCPRCSKRTDADVIAELNTAIEEGVHAGSESARVIMWDWGWRGHGEAGDIIAKLPKNAWFMSVSEWDLPIERGGVKSTVGEYSISSVGPGPRASRHWKQAQEAGLRTVAKVQLNNTWELSAVPYLPVLDLTAEHCQKLAKAGVEGMMLSWSLGGYPSPNLQVAKRFADKPDAAPNDVLNALATERYGAEAAPHVRKAWTAFSDAFRQYPYHISVAYTGPQQHGPANLLHAKPTGYAATMVGLPYDDLNSWRGPYPADVFAGQFERVAEGWKLGLAHFREAVKHAKDTELAKSDLSVAEAAYLHFASVANQARFITARNDLAAGATGAEADKLRETMRAAVEGEIELARQLYDVTTKDSRIGFEASNHYYYVPQDLVEKVISCEELLEGMK